MAVTFATQSARCASHAAPRPGLLLLLLVTAGCSEALPPTPFVAAAAGDDLQTVQALLAAAPAPGPGDLQLALACAAERGSSRVARALLDAGAIIDGGDGRPGSGWTPLITAVHNGRWATARDLLAWGADPDAAAPDGVTPLIMITNESDDPWHVRMVEDLLLAGADPRVRAADGASALTNALAGGNPHIAARLLVAAPDLRLDESFSGLAVGVMASLHGDGELVDRARGVGPADEGWPPFLRSVRGGSVEQVLASLAEGADPQSRAPSGRTTLMVAAARGEPDLVRALLAAGVDPWAVEADGVTALTHAVEGGSVEIARELLDAAPGLRLAAIPGDEVAVFRARLQHRDDLLALLADRGALPPGGFAVPGP